MKLNGELGGLALTKKAQKFFPFLEDSSQTSQGVCVYPGLDQKG